MPATDDQTASTTAVGRATAGTARRLRILGIPVDDVTLDDVVHRVLAWIHDEPERLHHVVTVNPEFIMAARDDAAFRETLEAADLATPDGVGVILASRLAGRPLGGRVAGVDLVAALTARDDPDVRLFLLGAAPGIAARAADALVREHPACRVAGTLSGSPSPVDAPAILAALAAARPTVLLVAFGAPAQDRWIANHATDLAACGIVVAAGVGGTFDYLAGAVPRAPRLVRQLGFEWLYRLIRQPWRWRRQLALPRFVVLVLRQRPSWVPDRARE